MFAFLHRRSRRAQLVELAVAVGRAQAEFRLLRQRELERLLDDVLAQAEVSRIEAVWAEIRAVEGCSPQIRVAYYTTLREGCEPETKAVYYA